MTQIAKRIKSKLQGGSLQFVLFIGAVIAVLLLTFVLLAHSHFLFVKKTDKYVEMVKRTDYIIQQSLLGHLNSTSQKNELLEGNGISTQLTESNWGIYDILTVTSSFQKNSFRKTVLTGSRLLDTEATLFLKDNNRPMVVAGNASIVGDAYLPKQGIRMGNIGGQSFYASEPIQGRKYESTPSLPMMASKNSDALEKLLFGRTTKIPGPSIALRGSEMVNSFSEPTIILDADILNLSGKKISGNVVIRSSSQIQIDASTQLKDVILVAPYVRIGEGVVGNFQAIASKKIEVGQNCNLSYPSALVVLDKAGGSAKKISNQATQPQINIEKNSVVYGSLCYLGRSTEQTYYPQIRITEGARIVGQVYCQKNVELRGSVWGNVTTDGFVTLENGNVYQNHLFNGSMDISKLPLQFLGMSLGKEEKKGEVKWLY